MSHVAFGSDRDKREFGATLAEAPSSFITYEVKPPHNNRPLGGASKRFVDIVVSSLALVALFPLMAMIAVLILLILKRPIFFSHERVGQGGRLFRCYKFRTMVLNAEEVLQAHLHDNPQAREEWERCRKLAKDPRVPWLGRILRITSLDELPQFFNILRGDMSCVGPRPVVANELYRYGNDAECYLRARPGLTGAWQVSGRSALSYEDRVALDRDYVNNWAIKKDIGILLRTLPAVLRFKETA